MNSELARKCFDEWKHLGVAIVLQADCEFEEVIDHLRGLLMARWFSGSTILKSHGTYLIAIRKVRIRIG
jgi:hypothetical protein